MSHSKAPWRIDAAAGVDCGYGRQSGAIVDADGRAVVVSDPSEGEYGPALDLESGDARLIAAAPDLLAACIEARVWLLGHESAERQIALLDAAISNAAGEQA